MSVTATHSNITLSFILWLNFKVCCFYLLLSQAVFDTDPKLDHAPMVQYCATSSIKDGHSLSVCDVQWIPDHIEVCPKTFQVLEGAGLSCNQIISCSIDG